jgi:hypothetical protein
MEDYSAIKNNEFIKFLGKWMDLEDIILREVAQSQKNTHDMHQLSMSLKQLSLHLHIYCVFKWGV